VTILPGTRAAALYGAAEATEDYYCSYGVNPAYRQRLVDGGLTVSGLGGAHEIRIVELAGHPFFLATLFLPQARSAAARPHPLLAGYAAAVAERYASGRARSRVTRTPTPASTSAPPRSENTRS
jgi:CTP synthase (UTP-ammonia lyase)